ncbi:potassium channel family protein [Onishia niordana]|uniref:potassium channel family protein n=1 Tax=Onishia niordana TaxID=2508711 RepID=UPI001F0FD7CB|nr:potassium channel family protein [Halomonas niordiana]
MELTLLDALLDPGSLLVVLASLLTVALCVLLHYEVSMILSRRMEHSTRSQRQRFLTLIFGLLGSHIAQIWAFAATMSLLLDMPGTGEVVGITAPRFLDFVYLSAINFTTLGYGDIVPDGPIRFVMGTEALTGFMLITWSASLTFLEMQKHWRTHHPDQGE